MQNRTHAISLIALPAALACAGLTSMSLDGEEPGEARVAPQEESRQDWPMWGHDQTRNMSCDVTGLPSDFSAGDFLGMTDQIDPETTRNVKWVAKLGSQSYGNPTVSNGRVFVGTNNDSPRDDRFKGDRSVVNCFDEETGELIWQLNNPKLGTGKVSDWEFLGICSSPAVEGDRVYVLSNHCEVMCLDFHGMANGNDGPFKDEGAYMAWRPNMPVDEIEPFEVMPHDADIIWTFNMIKECGVFPHNITSSSILIAGDTLWVSTSNGVDYGHVETPAPYAPCLITVNKHTGELIGEEQSGLSQRVFHGNWTSPAYLETDELELCVFGGPDGWVYAFKPEPVEDEDGYMILDEAWRCDANKPEYRVKDGKPVKYATRAGPSEVLGTVVVWNGLVYAPIGQDPEHGEGYGNLVCIDPTGSGDVTDSHIKWQYGKINRSLSTCSIRDGLLFVPDFSGFVYCLDAMTGEEKWVHDTKGHIWGSPLVADDKVYIANEDGYMTILPAKASFDAKKDLIEIDMVSPVYSSPIAANGTLFVSTHTHLYAIEAPRGQ